MFFGPLGKKLGLDCPASMALQFLSRKVVTCVRLEKGVFLLAHLYHLEK